MKWTPKIAKCDIVKLWSYLNNLKICMGPETRYDFYVNSTIYEVSSGMVVFKKTENLPSVIFDKQKPQNKTCRFLAKIDVWFC